MRKFVKPLILRLLGWNYLKFSKWCLAYKKLIFTEHLSIFSTWFYKSFFWSSMPQENLKVCQIQKQINFQFSKTVITPYLKFPLPSFIAEKQKAPITRTPIKFGPVVKWRSPRKFKRFRDIRYHWLWYCLRAIASNIIIIIAKYKVQCIRINSSSSPVFIKGNPILFKCHPHPRFLTPLSIACIRENIIIPFVVSYLIRFRGAKKMADITPTDLHEYNTWT